jgi:LuxR family transcriptional regulator, maltose regulon positive regulatory protein
MTTDQPPPGGLAAKGLPPLAEAKLAPPRPRPGVVGRPRIMEMLDAGRATALTVVAAPAGYGKTTAVRQWAAQRDAALAWVTLDASDDDPVRLWTYAATAVDRVRQGLGGRALRRLGLTGGPIENPIDELMEGIASLGHELVLVLDDLQAVTDPDCIASLEYAVRRAPANARLIAITRSDPPMALAHLRARGMLAEVRAGDLAFTASETREFFAQHGPTELTPDEIVRLQERTEGWPAALLLASLWLRTREDLHEAVQRFGGDHRFVADYLSSEVLGSLDGGARSFLLRAAVLGRFTAGLVDDVLGRSDSAAVLADLERTNLFFERLERGGWYRVHSLFAEFAGFQLAAHEPEAVSDIHRRAAAWLRTRGLVVEAAEHAAAAGDHEMVAELLVEYHLPLIRGGGAGTLLRWVRALPEAQLVLHPELAVGAATAATMVGGAFERRQLLNLADRARIEQPARFTPYVEAVAAMVRASAVDRDVGEAVIQGRRAVAIAESGADAAVVAALGGYARALYLAGELDAAWDAALRAVEHPDVARRMPGHAFARSTLALVAVDRGRLETARLHADKAKALLGGVGSIRSWLGANASAALGAVLAAEGDYAEAEREVVNADRFFRDEVATVHHAWLMVLLARVRCARGRIDDARDTLRLALDAIGELGDCGRVPSLARDVGRELSAAGARARRGELLDPPSDAELAVLVLLAGDLSTRQIAGELFLSPNTVRTHTRAIYRKFAVNSRAEAVARAQFLGLLGRTESPM